MSQDDDDDLEAIWADLHLVTDRPQKPDPLERLRNFAGQGGLAIGTSAQPLVVIRPNGDLEFGPNYKPDEAARLFWQAMGRQRHEYEQNFLLQRHMEGILTRIGAADLRLEALRLASQDGDTAASQQVGRAHIQLEQLVHQAIELGRGLSRRPEMPTPTIPEEIPERIRNNPLSNYEVVAESEEPEVEEPDPNEPQN